MPAEAKFHHAYLLVGSPLEARAYVDEVLLSLGTKALGNPDFFELAFETLGIDDARILRDRALHTAFGTHKFFWLAPKKITREAQNALLKTFEEPIGGTHFFLHVREAEVAIPTLRSRMEVVHLTRRVGNSQTIPNALGAKEFVEMPLKKRLNMAKKFADEGGDLPGFIDELLLDMRRSGASLDELKSIAKLRGLANAPSAPARLMLEHLALVL